MGMMCQMMGLFLLCGLLDFLWGFLKMLVQVGQNEQYMMIVNIIEIGSRMKNIVVMLLVSSVMVMLMIVGIMMVMMIQVRLKIRNVCLVWCIVKKLQNNVFFSGICCYMIRGVVYQNVMVVGMQRVVVISMVMCMLLVVFCSFLVDRLLFIMVFQKVLLLVSVEVVIISVVISRQSRLSFNSVLCVGLWKLINSRLGNICLLCLICVQVCMNDIENSGIRISGSIWFSIGMMFSVSIRNMQVKNSVEILVGCFLNRVKFCLIQDQLVCVGIFFMVLVFIVLVVYFGCVGVGCV